MSDDLEERPSAATATRTEEPPTPERIVQVGIGFWASKALLSAVEMDLFTELADGPLDLDTLRERLDLHPRSARDFLDALVALGFLEREDGVYRNAPDADRFLDEAKPSYIGGMFKMANRRLYRFWGDLTRALRTGKPQNEIKHGGDFFEKLYSEPDGLEEFLGAMTGLSRGANLEIAESFPWQEHETFLDVGTAQGDLPVQVARAHPHLDGIGFDLPPVEPIFREYVERNDLDDRLDFVAGDFFEDELPPADVLVMGHILHDWSLEEKKELIAKAWETLPDDGALIVYESIIDDDRSENDFGLLMSLNMLIETPDGFDYTGAECREWMEEVGFRHTRVQHLVGPDSMVVGVK